MTLVLRDSQNPSLSTPTGGAAAVSGAGALINAKVLGVMGDIGSELTRYEALITSSVSIPQCSFASVSTILSDEGTYPYFYRTIPTVIAYLEAILNVIKSSGWRRITVIYDLNYVGLAGQEYFMSRAEDEGIYVLTHQSVTPFDIERDPTFKVLQDKLHSVESRIQILLVAGPLQESILREMKNAGFFGPEFAWIIVNYISQQLRQEPDVHDYDGLIMVDNAWNLTGYEPYDTFERQWMQLNSTEYPGAGDPILNSNEAMAYSCVMMLAHAYGNYIRSKVQSEALLAPGDALYEDIISGQHPGVVNVPEYYEKVPYCSPSGSILLDTNGDRKDAYYNVLSLQNGTDIPIAISVGLKYIELRPPPFKDGYSLPPDAPSWAKKTLSLRPQGILLISLTIKNYRIYRIFNSITIANDKFQTRRLLRFVALAVLLSALPMLIKISFDPTESQVLNVGALQWVRCDTRSSYLWWALAASAVPIFLLLFGVFLAFKTRNVIFLWNEARQIALVLYNIFTFAILYIIAYLLPTNLFSASVYMIMAGGYFANTISLAVLFVPKFWRIQKSRKQSHQEGDWDQHPPRLHKLGLDGNVLGGTGKMTGAAPILGRMPGSRAFGTASTSPPWIKTADMTGTANPSQTEELSDEASTAAITDLSNQTAQSMIDPILEQERNEVNSGHRRSSLYPGQASASGGKKQGGNTMNVWMDARTPQEMANVDALSIHDTGEADVGPNVRGSFMDEHDLQESKMYHPFRHEQGEIVELQSTDLSRSQDPGLLMPSRRGVRFGTTESLKPEMDEQHTSVSASSSSLPMSTGGKSNSYLMTSMYQLSMEQKPTLRIETSNNRTLLIRFANQERLDEWMNLFSAEDLIALGSQPAVAAGKPSSFDTVANRAPRTLRQRQISGAGSERHQPKASRYGVSPTSRIVPHMVENVVGAKPLDQDLRQSSRTDQLGFPFKPKLRDDSQGVESDHSRSRAMFSDQTPIQSSDPWSGMSDGISTIPTPSIKQDRQQSPLILSRDNDPATIDDDSQMEMDSLRPTVQTPAGSLAHPKTESTADDDHDDDDLYDPEFGIGGVGRRRFIRQSSAPTQSRTKTGSGSIAVPSPAVISTAAAAVSAGWSESEALTAATADPSGSFLLRRRNSDLSNSNANNNATELTSSSSVSKPKPKIRGREISLSSLTELPMFAPQSQRRSFARARGNKSANQQSGLVAPGNASSMESGDGIGRSALKGKVLPYAKHMAQSPTFAARSSSGGAIAPLSYFPTTEQVEQEGKGQSRGALNKI
ncbi:hypothetical protein BGZ50_001889 [Haplosporangium sp. Z 11]|nr:hypothetical protein BGZ50_001889 [Haplosporangium sp. Z 11]